jgi:glycosyltransferase involved in cell wall biosynthesis
LKVSIITATYNSASTIRDTLESVANQTYKDIEHIIVDGLSNDETLEIVREYPHVAKIISEPDQGIYDAINKGIQLAQGEVVGILNSDDFLSSNFVITKIVESFNEDTDAIIADITFVSPSDVSKTIRYYSSKNWRPNLFRWGFMPPHPSFYLRKEYYDNFGLYKNSYKIAADYELLIRMLYINKLNYKYINLQTVTMRTGGVSTENFMSRYTLNKEIIKACAENGIYTNMIMLVLKYFIKVFEFLPKVNNQKT